MVVRKRGCFSLYYQKLLASRCRTSLPNIGFGYSAHFVRRLACSSTIPPKATFYVPKAERGPQRTAFDIDYVVGETRLARNSRTCPTRELNFSHTQWGRHKSPYRRFRHMASLLHSAPFQRIIFPELASVAMIAGCLTYYNECIAASNSGVMSLSMSPTVFAGATTAIGLLAGFRLNSSYARVKEGREVWGIVNTATRDLARHVLMWMKSVNSPLLAVDQLRMLRLCQAFPVALMFYSNGKGCHHNMKRISKRGEAPFEERIFAEFAAELGDVYDYSQSGKDTSYDEILQKDLERLLSIKKQNGNVPLEVLTCMSEILSAHSQHEGTNETYIHPVYIMEMDNQIHRLGLALGWSERISKTPLPTGFTRHSSRLLFMWSNSLPFALYPLLGPFNTLPTAILTAYAVLGVEDISIQLEEPFDILPLREYSDSIIGGVDLISKGFTKNNGQGRESM